MSDRFTFDTELTRPVQYLPGVGPRKAEQLARRDVATLYDLLIYRPLRYVAVKTSREAKLGEEFAFRAKLLDARFLGGPGRKSRVEVMFHDGHEPIPAVFFGGQYRVGRLLTEEKDFLVTAKLDFYGGRQLSSPALEPWREVEAQGLAQARMFPIYPLTQGLQQHQMRALAARAVSEHGFRLREYLDEQILGETGLPSLNEALTELHRPSAPRAAEVALDRLAAHELFLIEYGKALLKRDLVARPGQRLVISEAMHRRILSRFPFTLTKAQERAIADIRGDLQSGRQMNRLLQGDVGSGKTVVALYAALAAIGNGAQAAVLAPTEVLARQHFETITRLLEGSRTQPALLIGASRGKARDAVIAGLASGKIPLLIGTHAILEGPVAFARLAVTVVDEQHKFGVLQREALAAKGAAPHLLVMSATPIPRTLSLTVFGELDLSTLNELPPGRQPVDTRLVSPDKRDNAYRFIRDFIRHQKAQGYVITPLVEASKKIDAERALTNAIEHFEHLRREVFADLRLGLVHGKMKSEEKAAVMERFQRREIDLLVATVVIEVGIDVPNAALMVIEDAERFGLAQLHQLRGRIGRSDRQSTLVLFANPQSEESKQRLKIFAATTDGFRIAEEDLRLRGFGDFLGTRQHGFPKLRLCDPVAQVALLEKMREAAFDMVKNHPQSEAALTALMTLHFGEATGLGVI